MLDLNHISFILIFLPLLAASIVGFNTSRMTALISQIITCGFLIISALLSLYIFDHVAIAGSIIHVKIFTWFDIGDFKASWSIYIDQLTAVMLVVVTVVSAVVHVYSIGYMSHDEHRQRFMCYLSLFTFCMLMLVSADNFAQLFFGWEGVGLCSYLLIGFWFKKQTANAAAIKAFLVNRVGDFGFALGIFLVFWTFGSIEYDSVFSEVRYHIDDKLIFFGAEISVITVVCLFLFIGAMGKSAQLGLHTWLPDAMEGPTPVSALIHAATMVTAGVFMVARCSPLFEYSQAALSVVTCVGAFTCLFAATVALVQNDIKRIIAYSTCSQLGYMFFACGVSAYAAGIFHLMTHAFFKALLFLGAGSVIHAMSDEQDIRKMGGIWKKIPLTYGLMWIGSLALAGIYPFAGFYSKDIVLESAFAAETLAGTIAFWFGILAAILTAFYSWRLIILTFHGPTRASSEVYSHVHESPYIMIIPLIVLAIGAIGSGFVGANILKMVSGDDTFWKASIFVMDKHNSLHEAHRVESWVAILPLGAGLLGIATAYFMYMYKVGIPTMLGEKFNKLYNFLLSKWYFDELYDKTLVVPSKNLGRFFWRKIDMILIDGMPNGAAAFSDKIARITSMVQTGIISHYAFVMVFGLLFILSWMLFIF